MNSTPSPETPVRQDVLARAMAAPVRENFVTEVLFGDLEAFYEWRAGRTAHRLNAYLRARRLSEAAR